jgi:hypothetical protein
VSVEGEDLANGLTLTLERLVIAEGAAEASTDLNKVVVLQTYWLLGVGDELGLPMGSDNSPKRVAQRQP